MNTYFPGTRVKVFDSRIYKDDISTPLSVTIKSATVVRWYGRLQQRFSDGSTLGPYPSLIDVIFDGETTESKAHFANNTYVDIIEKENETH